MEKSNNQADLEKELAHYEAVTEMTEDERQALREWVANGYSVYDNASYLFMENGEPADFLYAYRFDKEIREDLEQLDEHDQENYLARLRGEDTQDNLREGLDRVTFELNSYGNVLKRHHLYEEARAGLAVDWEDYCQRKKHYDFDDEEELPFPL